MFSILTKVISIMIFLHNVAALLVTVGSGLSNDLVYFLFLKWSHLTAPLHITAASLRRVNGEVEAVENR